MGRFLIGLGVVLVVAGLLVNMGVPVGRLPGDFTIRRGNVSFYFPLTTSIVVSILLTFIVTFLGGR
jgi:hypothetical protein